MIQYNQTFQYSILNPPNNVQLTDAVMLII